MWWLVATNGDRWKFTLTQCGSPSNFPSDAAVQYYSTYFGINTTTAIFPMQYQTPSWFAGPWTIQAFGMCPTTSFLNNPPRGLYQYTDCLDFKETSLWKNIDADNAAAGYTSNMVEGAYTFKLISDYASAGAFFSSAALFFPFAIFLSPFINSFLYGGRAACVGEQTKYELMFVAFVVCETLSWCLAMYTTYMLYGNTVATDIVRSDPWMTTFFSFCRHIYIERGTAFNLLCFIDVILGITITFVVIVKVVEAITNCCERRHEYVAPPKQSDVEMTDANGNEN